MHGCTNLHLNWLSIFTSRKSTIQYNTIGTIGSIAKFIICARMHAAQVVRHNKIIEKFPLHDIMDDSLGPVMVYCLIIVVALLSI